METKVNIFDRSPKPQNVPPTEAEIEKMVFRLLLEIGISANLKGFKYLNDGIIAVYRDKALGNNIVGGLYAYLAEEYDTTVQCVERAIRHAMYRKQQLNGKRMAKKYFGDLFPLTPKKFINLVADELHTYDSPYNKK